MKAHFENLATMCRNASGELEKLIATTDCPALVAVQGALVTHLDDAKAHSAIQSQPIQAGRKIARRC